MQSRVAEGVTRGRSLILNLPGSYGAGESLSAVIGALEHTIRMVAAEGHG